MNHQLITLLLIPFAGTAFGSAMVFFLKDRIAPRLEKALLGFAAGVMIAASVWSLLIPSMELAKEQGIIPWLPATVGFLAGMAFLLLLDTFMPHLHLESEQPEGLPSTLSKSSMLLLAITLHNIPEGMAVGATYAAARANGDCIQITVALALSIGIAIQNFPEGAVVSMPLKSAETSRSKAFIYGTLTGIVEPVAAFLTIVFAKHLLPLLSPLLAFAAGAMMYVVIEELIPEAQSGKHSNIGTVGAALGFVLMMILDVTFG